MKFVIVSPHQAWGGPIVLHALCKYLSELGHDAKIFYNTVDRYEKNRPVTFWSQWGKCTIKNTIKAVLARTPIGKNRYSGFYYTPVRGCKRKFLPWVSDDTIVIYPEVTYGNFLRAKNVVRWFLYHNRYKDKPDAYGKDDLFVCYREVFNDYDLNPDCVTVCTPYYDLDTYKQYNFGERIGTCYVVRKGKDRADLPTEFDGIIIDDLSEKEKVKVFNDCEYCISYDTQTSYSEIAALCGCISVIIPEPGKSMSDYRSAEETSDGVAWGFSEEEIDRAMRTRENIYLQYLTVNESSRKSAEEFVKVCRDYFNKQ